MVSPIWRETLVYSDTQHTHLGMLYRRHNSKIHTFMCFHARSAYPYLQENNTGKHITKAHPHIYQHTEFTFDISLLFDKKKKKKCFRKYDLLCFLCLCVWACMYVNKRGNWSLALFNHTNAAHIHTIPSALKENTRRENREPPWRIDMNYSLNQIRGQRENERETEREKWRWSVGDTKKETDWWIDKYSRVLCCITSNDKKVLRRFEIKQHS